MSLQVFADYEKLLHSENYVTKRQSLKVRFWLICSFAIVNAGLLASVTPSHHGDFILPLKMPIITVSLGVHCFSVTSTPAPGRALIGPTQLHGDDALHQQARESQADDESAKRQESQHPVWGLPCLQGKKKTTTKKTVSIHRKHCVIEITKASRFYHVSRQNSNFFSCPCCQVFVANPNKTQPIVDILLKNQTKLIDFLSNFQKDRTDDEQFNDEKTYLIKQIRDLKKPAS